MESKIFSHPCLPMAKTYDDGHKQFPLLVTPLFSSESSLLTSPLAVVSYFQTHRDHLLSLLRTHGVLHFRGFASNTSKPEDFAEFLTSGLGLSPFPYALGNAVRTPIVGDIVFTANEAPPDRLIPFHHELAQTPCYPSFVSFYCDVPAATGGETPIANSVKVLEEVRHVIPEFVRKCEMHGVVYKRRMTKYDRKESAIGRGWESTFKAASKVEVERKLKEKGYEWEWGDGELLTEISPILKAVMEIKEGKTAFFNQMYAAWSGWRDEYNEKGQCLAFGNGHSVDENDMKIVEQVLERHEVGIPWERGDFMVIDNMQAMHGRRSFTGKRVILASLSN